MVFDFKADALDMNGSGRFLRSKGLSVFHGKPRSSFRSEPLLISLVSHAVSGKILSVYREFFPMQKQVSLLGKRGDLFPESLESRIGLDRFFLFPELCDTHEQKWYI